MQYNNEDVQGINSPVSCFPQITQDDVSIPSKNLQDELEIGEELEVTFFDNKLYKLNL